MATWKDSVRLGTSEHITTFPAVAVIDAVPVRAQDRVLVKDQDNGVDNGIYEVIGASGQFRLRRAADMRDGLDTPDTSQTTVRVSEGATNAFTQWSLRVSGTVRVGTTSLPWARDYQTYSVESLAALTSLLGAPLGSTASVAGYATPGDNGGGDFVFVGVPATSRIERVAAASIRITAATPSSTGVTFTTDGEHGFHSGQSVHLSDVGAASGARTVVLPSDEPSRTFVVLGLTAVALSDNPHASCAMLTTAADHGRAPGSQRLAVSGVVASAGASTPLPDLNRTWDIGSVFDARTLTLPVPLPFPLPTGSSYLPGPAAVVGDGALLVPTTDGEGRRGGLWRRTITTPFHVAWWGALGNPDANTDDSPAINAAINSAKRFRDYDPSKRREAGSTVHLGPGVYRCSSRVLVDGPVSLEGAGAGSGSATMLIFPVEFGDGDALVDVVESSVDGSGTKGIGARIGHLQVAQDPAHFPDPLLSTSRARLAGIRVQASDVVLEDLFVHHVQGHGILIQGGGAGINANLWCLKGAVTVQHCTGSGVVVQGDNANSGSQSGILSVRECLEWGLHEHSFLGNSWSAIHTEGNGLRAALSETGSPVWTWQGNPVPPKLVWSSRKPIALGQLILPTFPANPASDPLLDHRTGYAYRATMVTGEGRTGQDEPRWPTPQDPPPSDGLTVRDGDVVWTRWSYEGGALYHEGLSNFSTYHYIYVEAGQQPCRFDPGAGGSGTATVDQVFEMHPSSQVIAANVGQYAVPFVVRSRRSEPWDENPLLGQIRHPVIVGLGDHLGEGVGERPRPKVADWAVASFKRADAYNDWGHNAPGNVAPDVPGHWRHDVGVLKDRWDGASGRLTLGGLPAPAPALRWRVEWDVEGKGREAHPLPFHSYSQVGGRSLPQPAAMCFPSLWLGNRTGVERRLGAVAAREDGAPDLTGLDASGGNAFERGDILFNAPLEGRPNWPAAWRAARRTAIATTPQTAWNLRLYFYAGYVLRDDRGGLWRAGNSGFSADGPDVPTTRPAFETNHGTGVVLPDGDISWQFWGTEDEPSPWEPLITQAPTPIETSIGSATTSDDVPMAITLVDLADTEVRRIDVVVTAASDARQTRGTWSLTALAARVGATASLDGGEDDRAIVTDDGLAARLQAVGTRVQLECTGLTATDLTWGWEVRAQRPLGHA